MKLKELLRRDILRRGEFGPGWSVLLGIAYYRFPSIKKAYRAYKNFHLSS